MSSPARSPAALLASLVALALIVAVIWWLARPDARETGEPVLLETPRDDRGAPVVPGPMIADPVPASPSQANPGEVTPAAVPAEVGEGTTDQPQALPSARLTGVVTDERGSGIAGATVFAVPTGAACHEIFGRWVQGTELPVHDLPRVTTGADGAFALDVPSLLGAAGTQWPFVPELVARAAEYGTRAVSCRGFDGRAFDVGPIALAPGGSFAGRVVDERGRALDAVALHTYVRRLHPAPDGSLYTGTIESFLTTTTGADGRFEVTGLPACHLGYAIALQGFVSIDVYGLELPPGGHLDVGDIVLETGASISGWVTDADGEPVPGALLLASEHDIRRNSFGFDPGDVLLYEVQEATRDDDTPRVRSGADGRFTLDGVRTSLVTVYVDAVGFEPLKLPGVVAGERSLACVVQHRAMLVVTAVDDASDQPLVDFGVEVVRDDFVDDPSARLQFGILPGGPMSDVDVRAQFISGVGPLDNTVTVSAPGYATERFVVPGMPAPGTTHFTARLSRGASLTGRLVGADGGPVGQGLTGLTHLDTPKRDSDRTMEARSAADGRFRFDGLRSGRWQLVVGALEPLAGFALHEHDVLDLAAGEQFDLGDVVLRAAGTIVGTVFAADGVPVPGALLHIAVGPPGHRSLPRVSGRPADVVLSDADGRFRFESLMDGEYELRSEPGGLAVCAVTAGATTEVAVHHARSGVVVGRVTAGGAPLADVRVYLREVGGKPIFGAAISRRTAHTDEAGEYRLAAVTSGPHTLTVSVPSGPRLSESFDLSWGETIVRDFQLGGASLSGVVVQGALGVAAADSASADTQGSGSGPADAAGPDGSTLDTPVAEAAITLRRQPDGPEARVRSDAEGRFVVRHLPPGDWSLRCDALPFASVEAGPWALEPDEQVDGVRIALPAGAAISGVVVPPQSEMLPAWTCVALFDAEGQERRRLEDLPDDGAFRFAGLPPGPWRVRVFTLIYGDGDFEDSQPLTEVSLQLDAAEQRDLEIELP